MKLFKYHAVNKYSLSALIQEQIWATNPKDFNDPYDCAASVIVSTIHPPPVSVGPNWSGGFTQSGILDEPPTDQQKDWIKQMGVYCLCKKNTNRLMWGHYADHFKGFCIEYTFNDCKSNELVEVKYPKDNRFPTGDWPDDQHKYIKRVARYKARNWKYEKEYRLIFDEGNRSYDISGKAQITSIIFGSRCEPNDQETIEKLIEDDVRRWKIETPNPGSFDIILRELT